MSKNAEPQTIDARLKKFNNNLFECLTRTYDDYKIKNRELSFEEMIQMKSALSDVNNIITLLITRKFVEKLREDHLINAGVDKIDSNPNANGYDLLLLESNNIIIAEVKGNKPCKKISDGYIYGSDQQKGIIKDLTGLIKIKKKASKKLQNDFHNAIRFMVLLDSKYTKKAFEGLTSNLEPTDSDSDNDLKKAKQDFAEALRNFNKSYDNIFEEYTSNPNNSLDSKKIYVYYIQPDDNLISELLDNKNN